MLDGLFKYVVSIRPQIDYETISSLCIWHRLLLEIHSIAFMDEFLTYVPINAIAEFSNLLLGKRLPRYFAQNPS